MSHVSIVHGKAGAGQHNGTVPPACNTGAQKPLRTGLKPCIDWIQATFKNAQFRNPDELIEGILLLDPEKFTEMETGMYGYRKSKRMGNIAVFYDGREDMGIHLQMSGAGCREFENISRMDWKTFFTVTLAAEAQFTRLDIALDDHVGYWTMSQIARKVKRGEVVSKFKRATRIEKVELESGKTAGETIYFGSSSSKIRFRFYDKRLEQLSKEGVDPEEVPEVWNRVEIQSREDRSQTIAAMIAEGIPAGTIVTGVLKYYIRFAVKGKDKKRYRWKTAPFWERFLADVEPLRLTEKNDLEQSIEKRLAWLHRQAAPTMAAIIKAFDGEMTAIYQLIREGMQRLKPKDYAMIRRHKETMAYLEGK